MVPLLPYFLVYTGGILFAFPESSNFLVPLLLPVVVTGAGVFFWLKSNNHTPVHRLVMVALLLGGAVVPGLKDRFPDTGHVLSRLHEGRPAIVEGELSYPPVVLDNRIRYRVNLKWIQYADSRIPVHGLVRITHYLDPKSDSNSPEFRVGEILRFNRVRLKLPRNFRNPGRFDYRRYLRSQGITVIGNLASPRLIHKTGTFYPSKWIKTREYFQKHLFQTIDLHFPGVEGGLLKAMVLGEKHFLDPEIREAYIATGLAHLMAVSGLHIGFVAGAAFFVFRPLTFGLLWRFAPAWVRAGYTAKIAAGLCLFPLGCYLLLVGSRVSAVRAGVMVLAFLLAILVNRRGNLFNALLTAAFIILLWNPETILDVSFQLTFMAVAGILFAFRMLPKNTDENDAIDRLGEPTWVQRLLNSEKNNSEALHRKIVWRFLAFLAGCALASTAAILATLPILLVHFHRISLAGILINPVMVPFASILIPFALFALSVATILPFTAGVILFPVFLLLKPFTTLPPLLASVPFASVYAATPPGIWIVLYYLLLFGGTWQMTRRKNLLSPRFRRAAAAGSVACAGLVFIWLTWPRFPLIDREELTLGFLDVGQGESIFIEFPNREIMLIDGGGFYKNILDVGKQVVAPFLWNRGINRIDYMAATHSDNDHISGLESLLDLFETRYYLDAAPLAKDPRLNRLREKALSNNTVALPFEPGRPLTIGEVRLIPLQSAATTNSSYKKGSLQRIGNSQSLVLKVEYREFSILLTGDIDEEAENHLLQHNLPVTAMYLKAPHHGSRYSNTSRFIAAVDPKAVFISSGYLNPMRHPHPEVLRRYEERGIDIWRTDLQGALILSTDGYTHRILSHEFL